MLQFLRFLAFDPMYSHNICRNAGSYVVLMNSYAVRMRFLCGSYVVLMSYYVVLTSSYVVLMSSYVVLMSSHAVLRRVFMMILCSCCSLLRMI